MLICTLAFFALYTIVVQAKGYPKPTVHDADPDEDFKTKSRWYFLASGVIWLGVVLLTLIGVMRESPTISMLCSIVMLLAVAQSLSNVLSNQNYAVLEYMFFSPAAIMTVIGVLLTIYTSLIWSSEFETPPHVIEEYKWYLNQIRSQTEVDQGFRIKAAYSDPNLLSISATTSRNASLTLLAAAAVTGDNNGSRSSRRMLVDDGGSGLVAGGAVGGLADSLDDLASESYYSSKSSANDA